MQSKFDLTGVQTHDLQMIESTFYELDSPKVGGGGFGGGHLTPHPNNQIQGPRKAICM